MTFTESVKTCFSNYATFKGRASRSEYWWFILFNLILGFILGILDMAVFGNPDVSIFTSIGILLLFIPNISVSVRRLHDINKSGWFYLLFLIPIIGAIILLIWFVKRGTIGANQFGEDPILD